MPRNPAPPHIEAAFAKYKRRKTEQNLKDGLTRLSAQLDKVIRYKQNQQKITELSAILDEHAATQTLKARGLEPDETFLKLARTDKALFNKVTLRIAAGRAGIAY